MTEYLSFKADLANPEVAEAFEDFTYWSSMFGQLFFRHLRPMPPLTVLDIGCGTGFPLIELADRLGPASMIHGIDAWGQAIARAGRKARVRGNTNVQAIHGDAADMPYKNSLFDLIVSNLGLNNFEAPSVVMAECSRVCKPKGRIALTTNLVGHMSEFYQIYEETLIDTGNSHLVERLQHHEAHRATPESLHNLFLDAGFEITNYQTDTFTLRYADGSAFFRAYLIRIGFLDGWRSILRGTGQEAALFEELEARLNHISRKSGEGLRLSIPAAYIEGRKK